MPDEVMMAVPRSEALEQAHILALRQIGEGQALQSKVLEKLAAKLDDVHDKVIKIEAQETNTKLEKLSVRFDEITNRLDIKLNTVSDLAASARLALAQRIDSLESERDRREGTNNFMSMLMKNLPSLITAILAALGAVGVTLGIRAHG